MKKSRPYLLGNTRAQIHGYAHHPLYHTWEGMKQRCCNPNFKYYDKYGGRGITICDEWLHSPDVFIEWSLFHGYKKGLTLDRKNNDKGYSPENCRWVSRKVQQNNRSTNHYLEYEGDTYTITTFSEKFGLNRLTVSTQLRRGWSVQKILRKAGIIT